MPVENDFKSCENDDSKLGCATYQLCGPGKSPLNSEPHSLIYRM